MVYSAALGESASPWTPGPKYSPNTSSRTIRTRHLRAFRRSSIEISVDQNVVAVARTTFQTKQVILHDGAVADKHLFGAIDSVLAYPFAICSVEPASLRAYDVRIHKTISENSGAHSVLFWRDTFRAAVAGRALLDSWMRSGEGDERKNERDECQVEHERFKDEYAKQRMREPGYCACILPRLIPSQAATQCGNKVRPPMNREG